LTALVCAGFPGFHGGHTGAVSKNKMKTLDHKFDVCMRGGKFSLACSQCGTESPAVPLPMAVIGEAKLHGWRIAAAKSDPKKMIFFCKTCQSEFFDTDGKALKGALQ
jgi:hypothetical protein